MSDDSGDMSFLEHLPNAPNTDLPPKSTDANAEDILFNIFLAGDISDNGSSIRA
jgi:hypothetical protein